MLWALILVVHLQSGLTISVQASSEPAIFYQNEGDCLLGIEARQGPAQIPEGYAAAWRTAECVPLPYQFTTP